MKKIFVTIDDESLKLTQHVWEKLEKDVERIVVYYHSMGGRSTEATYLYRADFHDRITLVQGVIQDLDLEGLYGEIQLLLKNSKLSTSVAIRAVDSDLHDCQIATAKENKPWLKFVQP